MPYTPPPAHSEKPLPQAFRQDKGSCKLFTAGDFLPSPHALLELASDHITNIGGHMYSKVQHNSAIHEYNQVTYLFLAEHEIVELLLQHLVGVVDQELLEVVVFEDLEAFGRESV